MSNPRRWFAALMLALVIAAPLAGQPPPPAVRFDVLTDVGPVPAPPTCGCVTEPFKVTRLRPGWGYGGGPAAPDTDAPPSRDERRIPRERDRETLESLQANINDGLAGNNAARSSMGLELTTGTALKRDDVEAAKWFLIAAHQGHQNAYVQLGHRYHRGVGLEQSDEAAAYWFYQGATHGDTLGMIALGSLYAAGRGVPQNWNLAVSWWRKANHHRFVGDAYACGLGVAPNNERAVREYQQGADTGDMSCAIQLGHMHAGRCAAAADDALAYTSYDRAAHQGYPEAQVALASLELQDRGDGGPVSAYMWARLAELRLPDGDLRTLAVKRAAEAARRLSAPQIANTERLVKNMIETGAEPIHK
jgi:TPR repeat protein